MEWMSLSGCLAVHDGSVGAVCKEGAKFGPGVVVDRGVALHEDVEMRDEGAAA